MLSYFFQKSIIRRFIVLMSAFILLTCVSITSLLYHTLVTNFHDNYQDFFTNEQAVLQNILANTDGNINSALKQEVVLEPKANHYQYFISISKNNDLVLNTPGFSTIFPDSRTKNIKGAQTQIQLLDKTTYIHKSATFSVNKNDYTVQMILNITQDTNVLRKFKHAIFIVLISFFVLFLAIGYILIRLGLRPLEKFIHKIGEINPNAFQPLNIATLPSELEPLLSEVNKLISRTKRSFDDLSAFSSNIAHELRTPINNLMLSTEVLLPKLKEQTLAHDHLLSNIEEYQRLSNLINKLLFLARLNVENKKFSFEHINILSEIEKIVEFHEAMSDKKDITININVEGTLFVDKDLFHNALSNLLTNAINYSPKGSNITLLTEQTLSNVMLSVSDVGLGLSIVNSIMFALNAKLEMTNNTGPGLKATMVFQKSSEAILR
jgi:two-component system heavy metal sensor histidine kinase CusS